MQHISRAVVALAASVSMALAACSQANTQPPPVEANAAAVAGDGTGPVSAAVPVPEGAETASQANAAAEGATPVAEKPAAAAAAPAVGPDGRPKKPEPPPPTAADYAGKWQITDGNSGKICAVTLDKTELKGNLRATNSGCKTVDLTSISGWQLNGRTIVLIKATGEPIIEMQAASENRFDGGLGPGGPNLAMWR